MKSSPNSNGDDFVMEYAGVEPAFLLYFFIHSNFYLSYHHIIVMLVTSMIYVRQTNVSSTNGPWCAGSGINVNKMFYKSVFALQ